MRFTLLFVLLLLVARAGSSAAQVTMSIELVKPTDTIPRVPYKTWSLFLVCNPDWVAPEKSSDLASLYHRFQSFGDAIGPDNLAVWFWKQQMWSGSSQLSKNVDVARSAEFCRALGRPPSHGPYLVVTTDYPDVTAFPNDRAVFELGGLGSDALAKLLDILTDQLLLQGRVDTAMTVATASASPSNLWIRLLEGARQAIIGFGCSVRLTIDTGLFSAELRSCTGPS